MTATTLATWAAAIWNTLEIGGDDPARVFAKHNLNFDKLCEADARVSVPAMSQIWRDSVAQTGNEAFGLLVPANCSSLTFHSLGIALEASSSLREALERVEKLSHMVSDAADIRCIEREDGDVIMRWIMTAEDRQEITDQAIDAFMLSWVVNLPSKSIRKIRMVRKPPRDPLPWERSFQVPVEFSANEDQIVFTGFSLDAPVMTANPAIAMAGEKIALDYLHKMKATSVTLRVESELIRLLEDGEPRQLEVARRLHLSTRQLQRKLSEEGTSFMRLLSSVRHRLACSYLSEGSGSIAEVSAKLGFVDQSNFASAFKRWEGCSPREYRLRR